MTAQLRSTINFKVPKPSSKSSSDHFLIIFDKRRKNIQLGKLVSPV